MNTQNLIRVSSRLCVLLLVCADAPADDWPTFGHDNRRSHVTCERLALPLAPAWKYAGPRPRPAWPDPAKWDAYARIKDLASMRDFDPVYFVTAVRGRLWLGSSSDGTVRCLDAATGRIVWTKFTGGPVRVAPTWWKGKLYFGSDDGKVYCVDGATGKELWAWSPVEKEQWVVNNGKLISMWPCRTGVLVQNGVAYCAMSLLPWEPSYLCALDAETGRPEGVGRFVVNHTGMAMQAALAASSDRLFVSQGRENPIQFDLRTGKLLGKLGKSGDGGVWGMVTSEGVFIHGRGQNHRANGELREFDAATRQLLIRFPKAQRAAIAGGTAYWTGAGTLTAFDWAHYLPLSREYGRHGVKLRAAQAKLKQLRRQSKDKSEEAAKWRTQAAEARKRMDALMKPLNACTLWRVRTDCVRSLMVTPDLVFVGGDGRVAAFDRKDGRERWSANVNGKAYGLAAAARRLFVSTNEGAIYAFRSQ